MKNADLKELLRIFRFIKPNKLAYFAVLFGDILTQICFNLLKPIVLKMMIDASVKSDMHMLENGLLLTVMVSLLGMISFVTIEFFLFRSYELTTTNIRSKLFRNILKLPVSYIEQHHSGDTVSRLTNDIDIMQSAYSWPLRMILVTLLSGIGSALVMFILDWRVSVVLIVIGLISLFISIKQKSTLRKLHDRIQKSMGHYTENLSNIIGGFMVIKNFLLEKLMLDHAHAVNNSIFESSVELSKKSAFIESRNFFFSSINSIGVIIIASILALRGVSNLGSVVSFILLLGNVNQMFSQINGMILQLQGDLAGSGRVLGLVETGNEPDIINTDSVEGSSAAIEMNDIMFSYDGKNNALEGVTLTVEEGKVAALAGPSGGGKSTIIKLILGYYPPSSGKMTIKGKPLKSLTMAELRSMIAYVPQDSYVFDGTVGENIRFGRTDASMQEIIAAAKAAHADEFIQEMSCGYDTLVGERGIKLSGGQRQRIAIARAFLKDAPILLLDEATSSLDSQCEQQVQDALNTLMNGKTVLIIAHRLSTIEHADMIYLVDNGKIVEQGSHESLMTNAGMYRAMHDRQFTEQH